jgi:hypothetical protein
VAAVDEIRELLTETSASRRRHFYARGDGIVFNLAAGMPFESNHFADIIREKVRAVFTFGRGRLTHD